MTDAPSPDQGGGGMTASPSTAPGWRPGERRPDTDSMIRVDQAGEYGAVRIYCGQEAVLGPRQPAARTIARAAGWRWPNTASWPQ